MEINNNADIISIFENTQQSTMDHGRLNMIENNANSTLTYMNL